MAGTEGETEARLYRELSLTEFCREVSYPDIPSPAGGAVIAAVGAMLASLAGLVVRVSASQIGEDWQRIADETRQ